MVRRGSVSVAWVLGSGVLLAGCGRIDYESGTQGTPPTDSQLPRLPQFGPVRPVLGLEGISLDDPTLTADRLEILFNENDDLWAASRASTSEPFSGAAIVTELSTADYETSPEIANDGLTVWFSRDTGVGSRDIMVARRASRSSAWDPPVPVAELNTAGREASPTPSGDALFLTYARERDIGLASRSSTSDPWTDLGLIPSLVSDADEGGAILVRGATTIFFDSERPGAGLGDIWVAERPDTTSPFGAPRIVEELSTALDEGDPWVAEDGRYIVFIQEDRLVEAER